MAEARLGKSSIWDAESAATRRRVLLGLLLLTWALGLTMLDAKSLWLDEANGLRVTQLGLPALWAGQTELYHPPLFYMLLERWLALGSGEFFLRFPSVCFTVLSVLAAARLAGAWFGRGVALTTALLMALSPVLLWYAQELRPYALLVLISLVTTICVTRLYLRPGVGWWLAAAAAITAAIYLHYFALLLLGVHALVWLALLAARRTRWWTAILAAAAWAAALVAYWPWMQSPAFAAFLRLPTDTSNYVAILLTQRLGVPPALIQSTPLWLGVGIALGVASLGLLYWLLRVMHERGTWEHLRARRSLQALVAGLFVLTLVYFVVPRAYTAKRQLLLLVPYVLVGFAWWWPWQRQGRLLSVLAVLSLVAALANIVLVPKNQWREAAQYLATHARPGDIVLLTPEYMTIPYDLYAPPGVDREGVRYEIDAARLAALAAEHGRIWVIDDPFDTDPERRLQRWLSEHGQMAETAKFYRLDVRLYTREGGSVP